MRGHGEEVHVWGGSGQGFEVGEYRQQCSASPLPIIASLPKNGGGILQERPRVSIHFSGHTGGGGFSGDHQQQLYGRWVYPGLGSIPRPWVSTSALT